MPGISITGASSAEVIRLRCRTTLLLQHLLDRTHQSCAAHMPAAVQLELLDVLQVRHSCSGPIASPVLSGCIKCTSAAVKCLACALFCQLAGLLPLLWVQHGPHLTSKLSHLSDEANPHKQPACSVAVDLRLSGPFSAESLHSALHSKAVSQPLLLPGDNQVRC